jgi:uncharacterized Zn finger protein
LGENIFSPPLRYRSSPLTAATAPVFRRCKKEALLVRKVLARVDDARLGRAVAGLVHRELLVENVVRDGGEVRASVLSIGDRGTKVFGVGLTVVGRGHGVFCSCEDWRERGVVCKHFAAVALHELGAQSRARSTRSTRSTRSMVGLLLQL